MLVQNFNIQGLNYAQVETSRARHGPNKLHYKKENRILTVLKSLATEPMVVLLLVTSIIYFLSGNPSDGFFLAGAIVFVSAISLYQDSRSRIALEKLKDFSQPGCKVIRQGKIEEIRTGEVVVDDRLIVEEGSKVAADGYIIHSNDFSVDESILTGEAFSVAKNSEAPNNKVFMGTMVTGGLAVIKVTAIGNETELGKIGKSLESLEKEKSPLEIQINNFVKKMVFAGSLIFLIVWGINYFNTKDLIDSLLKALTLAMSILPEEIPVAFTTFMAMGAWRLMKMGVIVKQMKTVESLGSATVICTDKTGTLTENRMSLSGLYTPVEDRIISPDGQLTRHQKELIRIAMWASEPIPFDPMEKALHQAYSHFFPEDERPNYKMIHEYPLDGQPPMMTHIFENSDGQRIIAAKGAPEALLSISTVSEDQKAKVQLAVKNMASKGYRILGVGESIFNRNDFPEKQQKFTFSFMGLVAFYDPPKKNINEVLQSFYNAGIRVKLITGDNAITTNAIARQIDFKGFEKTVSGQELMQLPKEKLDETVKEKQVFTRMFPEAKLEIIKALKKNGEIVAMTGDGVNDAPALKAAHIGVAMGRKGSEIAKQAASLILLEDDLSKMVDAIGMGRKIYSNLKKAIQYIISIHIPIILTVFLPLALGWIYPNIFSPIHIIFLELIMGPTCSIIYENEPMEKDSMSRKPRPFTSTFFNWKELITSIIQGLMITAASLYIYRYSVSMGNDEMITRTMVFTTLIASNIFLTLINRSFYYSVLETLKYKNKLLPLIIIITILLTGMLLVIPEFRSFFGFKALTSTQLIVSCSLGLVGTLWFELVKFIRRWKNEGKKRRKGPL